MKIFLFRKIIIGISIVFSISLSKQSNNAKEHVSVSINELMLNDFFLAIGDVQGSGKKKVLGKNVKYDWKVKNPRIEILPNVANFSADVDIRSGNIKTSSKAKGRLNVRYNSKKNVIEINTSQIKADLSIKLFGSKVKLATIDLSKYYKPSFEFSGPDFNQKIISIEKPNGEKKQLQIGTKNHHLKIKRGKIIVTSDVVFTVLK